MRVTQTTSARRDQSHRDQGHCDQGRCDQGRCDQGRCDQGRCDQDGAAGEPDGWLKGQAMPLLRLAGPVIVARAGLMTMATIDTLLVGRYSAADLARFGLGSTPLGVMMAGSAGLLLGTGVVTAQARGAGRPEACGAAWRHSLPYALLIGLVFGLLAQFGAALFRASGQDPALAEGAGRVLAVFGYGMPAATLYLTTASFLEGLRRPLPGMIAMIVANLLNVPLDLALIWGVGGWHGLGAEGSAWATTSLRWLTAAGLVVYVLRWLPERHDSRVAGALGGWTAGGRRARRLGYAAGVSQAFESSAFAGLGLFAGLLGTAALGAFTVGLNLISLPFMAALGLAAATTVRVGEAYGAGNHRGVATAGWTGLGMTAGLLAIVALAYALMPDAIAAAFSRDAAVRKAIAALVGFSSLILVVDGGQTVMAGALRGRHDAWIPTALHFISYFAVMVPVSALLAFALSQGVQGLFQGILVASIVSVSFLATRFYALGRRDCRLARPPAPDQVETQPQHRDTGS